MEELYEIDVLEWSELQARLLRQHIAGKLDNKMPDWMGTTEEPDWMNIIKEIESIGRNSFIAVQSLLVQALLHDLKAEAWPLSPEVPHWRAKGREFREKTVKTITTTMVLRLDLSALYAEALHQMPKIIDGHPPCPCRKPGL